MSQEKVKSLEDRLIGFSLSVLRISKEFPADRFGSILADQIIRSSLSPALNYGEAQAAESRRDFIHKMKICLKELRETSVALRIFSEFSRNNGKGNNLLSATLQESNELITIFTASIKTASRNLA